MRRTVRKPINKAAVSHGRPVPHGMKRRPPMAAKPGLKRPSRGFFIASGPVVHALHRHFRIVSRKRLLPPPVLRRRPLPPVPLFMRRRPLPPRPFGLRRRHF